MLQCIKCGLVIETGRIARFIARGKMPHFCESCGKANGARIRRNQAARDRNAILREMCGTSAAAARRDMGMA